MPILDEYSESPVALVRDVIIDPENGRLIAFLINKKQIIVPMDIVCVAKGIFISDKNHIVPIDDVLRVKNVFGAKIHIIGAEVITKQTKVRLGRCVDYEIDMNHMVLKNIYVAKTFLFFRFREKIISFRQIVRIEKNKIIVNDSSAVTIKERSTVRSGAFAS